MEIDYELAEKIGATHYLPGVLYKFLDDAKLMCFYESSNEWNLSTNRAVDLVNLKPIPPKPQTLYREEYVKIESVFELDRDEMNNGHLGWLEYDEFTPTHNEVSTIAALASDRLYRLVKTPITEKETVIEKAAKVMFDADNSSGQINDVTLGALYDISMLKMGDE